MNHRKHSKTSGRHCSSKPRDKIFLILGHSFVLRVSEKFLNLTSQIAVKMYTDHGCITLLVLQQAKMRQCESI